MKGKKLREWETTMHVKARKAKIKRIKKKNIINLYQGLGYLDWIKWDGFKNSNPHPTRDIYLLDVLIHYHS